MVSFFLWKDGVFVRGLQTDSKSFKMRTNNHLSWLNGSILEF